MTLHPFDDAIRLSRNADGTFAGATSPAYANMVGPFGGITAAALLNGALQNPERLGDPVALTANYASPIADGAYTLDARPVRTNRSTQHWVITLAQGDIVAATATAVFAARRDTWSAPEASMPAGLPPPAQLDAASTVGRPAWTRQYDMRFVDGHAAATLDGIEQPHSESRLWVRDEPARPLDFASLASICDIFFPRVFVRRRKRVPAGTVTMTVFFHADAALLASQGDRHVLACARALAFRNGYFDQSAEIWSDHGQLLASTHQMVYYRE